MLKRCLFTLVILLLPVSSALAASIQNVSWTFNPISGKQFVVNVSGGNSLYLGCTYFTDSGKEVDLHVKKLNGSRSTVQFRTSEDAEKVIFCLWGRKVTRGVDRGDPNYWRYKKMGYIMDENHGCTDWISCTNAAGTWGW